MRLIFTSALLILLCVCSVSFAQDPLQFKKEVDSIFAHNQGVDKTDLVLFTGSSSIRLWRELKSAFPKHNVMNMGFGGSEMSDLLYYTNKLIIPFRPKQIFIYEGDNDISRGRSTEQILSTADSILLLIRKELPHTEVIFISPKPSVRRWALKEKYEAFNKQLKAWTATKKKVRYADVWTPMLDTAGHVQKDIFLADNLHLNDKGYAIWTNTLKKYLP